MKKRLLSLALAASMILGSVNVAFADEVSVPVDAEVVSEVDKDAEAVITDDVESDAAVEMMVNNAKAEPTGPNWSTTSPWEATVFGDAGSQDRLDNIGNPDYSDFVKLDGETVYPYDVVEDGKNVQIRMGVPNADDPSSPYDSQGKIAGSTDGRVFYYQKLTADDDFTITATAHVNAIDNTNNQVSFGAAVIDNIQPGVNYKTTDDSVNAGVRQMLSAGSDGIGAINYGFIRKNGAITAIKPESTSTMSIPKAGDDIKIQLKKSGTSYTIKFGNEKTTVDCSDLSMTDDIYVGLYAARCADITFKNVSLSVVGRKVELPAWETNGNGLNGDTDKVGCEKFEGDDTNFTLELSGDVGKFSTNEDSYSYRAVQAPSGEDFTLNSTITSIGITPDGTPKQAAAGFMMFDERYGKKNPQEGVEGRNSNNTYSNSLFIGLMTTDEASSKLVYRLRNSSNKEGKTLITEDLLSDSICGVGAVYNQPIDLMVKRSGDVIKIKVTVGDKTVTKDIDVTDVFDNNQYIGYAVARAGIVTVADNKLDVGTKKVKTLEVLNMPEKLNYYSTQPFDATGLKLLATYVDGTTAEIDNPDDYSLTGFDEDTYFTTPGERVAYASIGKVKVEIPVNVRPRKVTNISVDYAPIYDTYYQGGKFNTTGLQVTAVFEDGISKKLSSSEYTLTIGGNVVTDNTTITNDMVGEDVTVIVKHTDKDITIDNNNVTDAFHVAITPGKLTGLRIYTRDFKTTYFIGQNMYEGSEEIGNIHVPGLSIYGIYTTEDGDVSYQYIAPDFYEVVDSATGEALPTFKSEDVGEKEIKVQLKEDKSIFDTYTIKVMEPSPISVRINSYPRFTYEQGEAFSTSGLEFGILSTDNVTTVLSDDVFFFKNKTEFYKVYNKDITDEDGNIIYTKGQRVDLTEADVLSADFYIDLSEYNSEEVGTTSVVVYVNSKYGNAAINPVKWDITIVEPTSYIWKASMFGASSLGVKTTDPSSYINVKYADGTTAKSDKDKHEVKPELMENNKLDNIDSIDVVSWDGSGKISGDQDGIAYYYTKLNAKNNFSLSADITVNRYVFDVNKLTAEQKAAYDASIAAGDTPQVALDKLRSGQEAFGIMARDVIPYAGGLDEDGKYLGGATNYMTPFPEDAIKTSYKFTKENGDEVEYDSSADIYEAFKNQLTVTDANGKTYSISRQNVETQFTSNIVIAGGCTDSTWPSDPNSSSYVKKTLMNRINIMTRVGVVSTSGGGERVGIYSTTSKLPEPGDKYNITLTKMNTGYMITTYDYQTGDTVTKYSFEIEDDTENVLEIQDPDNLYVGFFASRYADMTVENVELHETNPNTDPIISATVDEAVSPKVTVNSPYYTTTERYALRLKSNSTAGMTGGVTNITMNGKTVKKDTILGNKENVYMVDLVPNSVNRFSVVYYPNTADNFLSYDPVVLRFTVTHSDIADTSKIYVAPNGTPSGDGTRDNPINFETALGTVGFGGEIIMLDGTYVPTNTDLGKIQMPSTYSGYGDGNFKTLRAEEGAHPVIDLQKKFAGFDCDADYWYFKGFDVCNSKDNEKAFGLAGKHCVVENCAFYNNGTTGFQISRINSSDATIYDWPSYNVVKSCESFNNCDPSKNNADGFAAKLTVGYGNVYEDCISHHNLDDGWDCYTKVNSGAIGAVVLENCISYKQGYQLLENGTDSDFNATSGGNGYKLGGEGIYVEHMLKDCLTFYNKASGVDTNNNPALIGRNVIAFDNYELNFSLYSNTASSLVDANGSSENEEGKVYKFNYDFEGAVSAGTKSIDKLSTINYETEFANVAPSPLKSESNYFKDAPYRVFLDKDDPDKQGETQSKYNDMPSKNSAGDVLDVDTFFVSTDATDAYGDNQRYSRAEDGTFLRNGFLERTEPYTHKAADIVTLPDVYGGNGGVGVGDSDVTTESTTTTEVTTTANSKGSSGAGGGGSVSQYKPKTTTTETTTVVESNVEATTQDITLISSIAVKVGEKNITIDNDEFAIDVAPYIQADSNSTMVPLRFVAIAIAGGDVEKADNSNFITWDAVAKTATIAVGGNSIVFTAGASTYTVNGNTLNISNKAVAEIVDSRMFVPFRTIGEVLGAKVSWDAATKTAMYN